MSYKIRTKGEKLPPAKERTNDGPPCRPTGNNFDTGDKFSEIYFFGTQILLEFWYVTKVTSCKYVHDYVLTIASKIALKVDRESCKIITVAAPINGAL